jgi:thioesterase domain-containing protein
LPKGRELWNLYGPTETTIWSTGAQVTTADQSISIGRPLANTRVYILNQSLRPVPIGVVGELFLAGEGLARGYLNRPELTAKHFLPNPFSPAPDARLYRTHDLARYREDGTIQCLGRLDHQVKIRGFRIELGEIEAVLSTHPSIAQCVVHPVQPASGDKKLVAYCASRCGLSPYESALREHLRRSLPEYMVPASFVFLDKLPLSPTGKVDRAALSQLEIRPVPASQSSEHPKNLLEHQLIGIWEKLLDRSPIGPADNFFDLGGHSLLATRLAQEVERLVGHRVPIASLFQAPTISALARFLTEQDWIPPWSSLVPLHPRGTKRPLFCVHGWGGNVYGFLDLARRLDPSQPVYGLQAVETREGQPLHRSVQEMATHYVREIRSFQPDGPYLLASYSAGGWIAFEMACQLEQEEQTVGLLALLDTHPVFVPWCKFVPLLCRYTRDRIGFHFRKLWHSERRESWAHLVQMRKNLAYMVASKHLPEAPPTHSAAPRALPEGDDYYWRLVQAYPIRRKFRGSIDLFASTDAEMFRLYYWHSLARGGVRFHPLPKEHLKLFDPDFLPVLVKRFQELLGKQQPI